MAELIAQCFATITGAPEWVLLMPAGQVAPYDGREAWAVTDAQGLIERSKERPSDWVIDYDHQTDYAKHNGQPAPAAGWIKELASRDGGIWGRVEWTEKARAMLEAKEYRYLSPTFKFDKNTREVTKILRAALVNDPALYLAALASAEHGEPKLKTLLERLKEQLALEGDVSEDALCSAITALSDKAVASEKVTSEIAGTLNLAATASGDEIATALASAISTGQPDPSKFIPMDQFKIVSDGLKALQEDNTTAKASAAVDAAVEAGKVTPGMKDWATSYAKADLAGFQKFVGDSPVMAGATHLDKKPAGGNGLSAEDIAVCKATGISEADFIKSKEGEAA